MYTLILFPLRFPLGVIWPRFGPSDLGINSPRSYASLRSCVFCGIFFPSPLPFCSRGGQPFCFVCFMRTRLFSLSPPTLRSLSSCFVCVFFPFLSLRWLFFCPFFPSAPATLCWTFLIPRHSYAPMLLEIQRPPPPRSSGSAFCCGSSGGPPFF